MLNKFLFYTIIICCATFKLWLTSSLLISAEAGQYYDDALYVNLAVHILNGQWLGPYDHLTLIKGPGYPLWLAFNGLINAPLLVAQDFLYILSGLFIIHSLRKIVENNLYILILFIIYLFNPFIETRVMREGIYPALSVLLISGFISIYSNRFSSISSILTSSLLAGIFLSMAWITREEGIWFSPALLIMLAYTLFELYKFYGITKPFIYRTVICFIPLIVLFISIQTVSLLNKIYYDSYTVVELNSRPFISAYGALTRVKHPNWKQYVDVPQDVRQLIYEVSPTFKELEKYLENTENKNNDQIELWKKLTCRMYPSTCGDIAGSWLLWSIREAAKLAGYYKSAQKANQYYKRLALEINQACEHHALDCIPPRETVVSPYRSEYLPLLFKTFITGIGRILSMPVSNYVYSSPKSSGPANMLKLFSKVAGDRLASPPTIQQIQNDDQSKIEILLTIKDIYHIVFLLFYIIFPLYLIKIVHDTVNLRINFIMILNIAILSMLSARLLILSLIDITSFPALFKWQSYIVPFYPLLLIFIVLAVIDGLSVLPAFIRHLKLCPNIR